MRWRLVYIIPAWLTLSVGSTLFLAFDYLMVMAIGKYIMKQRKPYFTVRSINDVNDYT